MKDRRWLILAVVGIAQLMVVLDATIVNIALPSAQADLGFSDDARQWVVTAYALAFGSLLLLGGRLSDLFGRKRAFLAGAAGFALASALGGAAGSFAMLVTARAIQGAFAALLAPAALSIVSRTFTDPGERGKAFGIYGAIAGGGGAVGLLLGGILTEYTSWRACMYVNLGFALPAALAGLARTATLGVRPEDAGVASAMVNTGQQVGGSIGTAVLSTLAATAAGDYAHAHPAALAQAAVHGYTTAFWISAGIFAAGALLAGALVRPGVPVADPEAPPAFAH
jgi:MFS family permease